MEPAASPGSGWLEPGVAAEDQGAAAAATAEEPAEKQGAPTAAAAEEQEAAEKQHAEEEPRLLGRQEDFLPPEEECEQGSDPAELAAPAEEDQAQGSAAAVSPEHEARQVLATRLFAPAEDEAELGFGENLPFEWLAEKGLWNLHQEPFSQSPEGEKDQPTTSPMDLPAPAEDEAKSRFYQDLPFTWLAENGWTKLYQEPYSHVTTPESIALPSDAVELFMGAMETSGGNIKLAAVGPAHVLEPTELNVPKHVDSVWWYMTPGKSVGFSKSAVIKQVRADTWHDSEDAFRLSWHLTGKGGYRVGSAEGLSSGDWTKVLFYRAGRKITLQLLAQMDRGTLLVDCATSDGETVIKFQGLDPEESGHHLARRIHEALPAQAGTRWAMTLPSGDVVDSSSEHLLLPLKRWFPELGLADEASLPWAQRSRSSQLEQKVPAESSLSSLLQRAWSSISPPTSPTGSSVRSLMAAG